nr:palindromic element RPE3 domain-containing protein [Rickettsia hoogstraalii]
MTQTYILKPVILEPYTEIQQNSQSFRQDEFKSKSTERTIVREHRLNSKNSPVSSFVNDAVLPFKRKLAI